MSMLSIMLQTSNTVLVVSLLDTMFPRTFGLWKISTNVSLTFQWGIKKGIYKWIEFYLEKVLIPSDIWILKDIFDKKYIFSYMLSEKYAFLKLWKQCISVFQGFTEQLWVFRPSPLNKYIYLLPFHPHSSNIWSLNPEHVIYSQYPNTNSICYKFISILRLNKIVIYG